MKYKCTNPDCNPKTFNVTPADLADAENEIHCEYCAQVCSRVWVISPSKGGRSTEPKVRCTPEIRAMFKDKATKAGMNMSDFFELLVSEA